MKASIKRIWTLLLAAVLLAALFAGCGAGDTASVPAQAANEPLPDEAYISASPLASLETIEDEAVILAGAPAVAADLTPQAPGTLVKKGNDAVIDYSNTGDGYVMVKYTASTTKKLKVQVKGPSGVTYTYNLSADGSYITLPLSDGSGDYKVTAFKNVSGTNYSTLASASFTVKLKDELAPFIRTNQYVNYNSKTKAVVKAAELTKGIDDPLKMVAVVYDYVVNGYTYDYDKAATVKSGYLPDLDSVYAAKKGICFDYAALMTAMLRSQGVATKLVVGYSGKVYHAWISVYSDEAGWINSAIYFDGESWKLMDPTFASSAKQSDAIMEYIGEGSNYTAKYIY